MPGSPPQHTDVVYVDAFVLKRKREQKQVNLGIRHLNDGSPLFRFHVIRNRAYVGKYFAEYGSSTASASVSAPL
ncbi:hypothetical protein [Aeromicrobium sp. UC242_57]|uniref:hypothetical protein n=1 Tax=Aeromicrobium sp. UC242_57 TaxID=3374624 RepID=UPI0037B8DCD6